MVVKRVDLMAANTFARIIALVAILWHAAAFAQELPFDWSLTPADSKYDSTVGRNDAKGYLRLGDMVILVPGNPPIKWKIDIREREYRRFGIEWRITGDVSNPDFEEYRRGFNEVMVEAIKKRYGNDFLEGVERRIELAEKDYLKRHRR